MMRYKMAVVWSSGVYTGYLAEGGNEGDAKNQALKMVFRDAATNRLGFTIVPPADVPNLSENVRYSLNLDWERCARILQNY